MQLIMQEPRGVRFMNPGPRYGCPPAVAVSLPAWEPRFQQLQTAIQRQHFQPAALLEVLHVAQKLFGYLSKETLAFIARNLRLPPSKVFGVATFYHMFTLEPRGQHICTVCLRTSCFMRGGGMLLITIEKQEEIKA